MINPILKIYSRKQLTSHVYWTFSSLTRYLYEYFGRKIIILVDEYDWPMEHARNFYDRANAFFGSMYSSVAKVYYFSLLTSYICA